MAHTPSIFDRLRSMQTEGLPLHTLIVEACEVGNELIAAAEALSNDLADKNDRLGICNPDLPSDDPLNVAERAIARAYPDDSNGNGSNGSNRSAA